PVSARSRRRVRGTKRSRLQPPRDRDWRHRAEGRGPARGIGQGMKSKAQSVKQYLDELPAERRKQIEAVRKIVRKNLPRGFVEEMGYGMIAYNVSAAILPPEETYNRQPLLYAALAAQKNFNALYLMWMVDRDSYERFAKDFAAAGKKLDM